MTTTTALRVAVATPLTDADAERIHALEPRVDLVKDDTLLPPMRWAADFEGDPSFHRTAEQQARFEALLDSADVLYGIPDVSPAALARTVRANPGLRWVQIMAAGGGGQVKAANLTAAELDRVIFTTGAGVHAEPLAEYALFGILAGAKGLPRLQHLQSAREWPGRWAMNQVAGSTALVMGLGHIGVAVARKAHALGARVIAIARGGHHDPSVDLVVEPSGFADVIGQADAIVNTLPGTEATFQMLGARELAAVRAGVTVVSVGRGTVIDEDALIAALRDGRVGFAALDVFAHEPLAPTSPLWDMPNVLVSPHTAANSPREERLLAELFAANATRFLDGQPMLNVVNTVEFY